MNDPEFGDYEIQLINSSKLLCGLNNSNTTTNFVHMRHHDHVINVPSFFTITAITKKCIAALEYCTDDDFIYGVQFHPEAETLIEECNKDNNDSNKLGKLIFSNFIEICNLVKMKSKTNN